MSIETLSSKRVQHYTQDIIAQTASNEPATDGENIDWQGALNGVIKKDDKLGWFGLIPFLFSGVGKDEGGTTGDPSILEPSTPLTEEDAKVRLQARLRWHNTLESAHSEAQLTYVVTSAMKSRENILTEPTLNRLADISDIRFIYAAATEVARKHGWVGAAQSFAQKAEEIAAVIEKLDPNAGSRVAEERQRFEALFPSGQTGFSAINLSDASAPLFQGADFFDNLFKPLTETPVKQPGADAFIAKVTELLGVRGKINSAMQEFRTATLPSLLGNSHINQPPPNNDANISLRVRTHPGVDLNVEVINLKERDFYLANGDPQGHETDNFQIMQSESLIVISQIYDRDGNPVAENKRETGKEYTEYEVRFNYDNNRLANVTLQKRTIVFAPDGVSITLKSSIGITHIHDEGINWFKLDGKGSTGKTNPAAPAYRLEVPVPEGAINPVVLQGVEAETSVAYGNPWTGDSSIEVESRYKIRGFATLAELESHIKTYLTANPDYRAPAFAPGGFVVQGTTPTKHETALGETVVVIPSKNIFDANGQVAGKIVQFNDHLTDAKRLPPGDYSRFTVQYYFNPDGSFKGIAVERTTLHTRPHNFVDRVEHTVHHQDSIATDRIASFGEPGWRLSAAERDKFVEEVSKRVAAVAEQLVGEGLSPLPESGSPQRGSPTETQEAVTAALRDWFSMEPKVRREITRLVGIRNSWFSDEPVLDRDRIELDWVASRAMAHIEGRGGTLFDVKRAKGGLQVTNAGVVFNNPQDSYSPDEIFTLGHTGEGFPSEPFINAVADALQGRVALINIPRNQLVTAIKRAFAERGYHNDNIFGPGHEYKGSRPTIPVIVNGRAMELETGVIESNVRDILFTPVRTFGEKWADRFRGFFRRRVNLGNVQATEYIPRAQLPELAMGTDGNLKKFKTLPEFLTEVRKRFGAATRVLGDPSGDPIYGRALNQLSEWTGYSVGLYAIEPGHGMKGFIEWIGGLHGSLGQIDFPMGYISHIARVRGDLYDSRGKYADTDVGKYHPHTAHDVYYFFDRLGNLASSMVVVKDNRSHIPSRVALRMDTSAVTGHVSYEQIKFKELVAKAMKSFKDGNFGRAYDAFVRLASGIGQLQEYSDSPTVVMALKRLRAAAHEAAGDMAVLDDNPKPSHYERALSLAREFRPEEFDSLKARVDEVKGEGGRDVIERIWIEMGADPLFRSPMEALEGGTITPEEMARPAVDMSAPMFDGSGSAIRAERMLRTRRAILEAHREALRAAERGRER